MRPKSPRPDADPEAQVGISLYLPSLMSDASDCQMPLAIPGLLPCQWLEEPATLYGNTCCGVVGNSTSKRRAICVIEAQRRRRFCSSLAKAQGSTLGCVVMYASFPVANSGQRYAMMASMQQEASPVICMRLSTSGLAPALCQFVHICLTDTQRTICAYLCFDPLCRPSPSRLFQNHACHLQAVA